MQPRVQRVFERNPWIRSPIFCDKPLRGAGMRTGCVPRKFGCIPRRSLLGTIGHMKLPCRAMAVAMLMIMSPACSNPKDHPEIRAAP